MSVLPNWNSIESTTRWSDGLFWIGAAALIVLAVAAVASHAYASRSTYLALESDSGQREANSRADGHYTREIKRLNDELASAHEAMTSTQRITAHDQVKSEIPEKGPHQAQTDTAPRTLSAGQKQLLVAALSPFSGQKVTVESIAGNVSGDRFKRDFVAVFQLAEWSFDDGVAGGPSSASHPPTGVQVTVNEDEVRAGRVLQSARVFVQTLQKLGITKGNTLFVDNQVTVGVIKLTIGVTS